MKRFGSQIIEHGRATEWLTSFAMLIFALVLMVPGDTLSGPGYAGFWQLGMTESTLAVPLALVAGGRMAALYINGHWRRTPMLRLIGACVGAGLFMSMAVSFGLPAVGGAALSTGAGTYAVLGLFDILAAYRSGADVRVAAGD